MIPVIYKEEDDRWIKGDRYLRPLVRRLLRRPPRRRSGMQKVVDNFLKGLDQLGIRYKLNGSALLTKRAQPVISFGLGMRGLEGVKKDTPVIAAIGFPYPLELPQLCEQYNVRKFLQHSEWVLNLTKSAKIYDDEIFDLWSAGIDTTEWQPRTDLRSRKIDVLIYNKLYWDRERQEMQLAQPIREFLASHGYSHAEIIYGNYFNDEYKDILSRSKVMIFLSAHESQGIAYQECLSSDVPVIAWDQGQWLDPVRFKYDRPFVPATSVPFFDERCGIKFGDAREFPSRFDQFFDDAMSDKFSPREFVLENLSIEKSTERMLDIYRSI